MFPPPAATPVGHNEIPVVHNEIPVVHGEIQENARHAVIVGTLPRLLVQNRIARAEQDC